MRPSRTHGLALALAGLPARSYAGPWRPVRGRATAGVGMSLDPTSTLVRPSALFERHLRETIGGAAPVQRYYQMMAYHLGWLDQQLRESAGGGGKRLRPALCLMACESVGAPAEQALAGALAVELVHNASLIHDDIEDGDEVRRHRPAVWALWGTGHGVNVGDGMLSLAHLAMLEASASRGTSVAARAGATLSRACVELFELFGCAAELGALLGGAGAGTVRRLGQFGRTLGRAFQMQDDLLGVWGDEARTGKPSADVRKRKRGLPAALAWECASPGAFAELCDLYAGSPGASEGGSERVLELFAHLDVQRRARRLVVEEVDAAIDLLPSAGLADAAALPLLEFAALLSTRFA
ncbi:MAG: polyprenyl synthetase family protein [Chloroflexi bacterium]|nr:MAG: polyprenyl synthetase family protein [Chloroflexota bacterium]